MKVKKYIAKTMPEAMKLIRMDFGPDAVILNSKEIKQGGFLGLFKKRKIEVIAAYDPQPTAPKKQNLKPSLQIKPNKEEFVKNTQTEVNEEVIAEIKQMKKLLQQQVVSSTVDFSLEYELIYNYLLEQELTTELAKDLTSTVVNKHKKNNVNPTNKFIIEDIQAEIEKRLTQVSFEGVTYEKKVVQFIGPTGVGKTTTLAKVAANSILNDKKRVAFITADTYRIAAIEQLKTYAQILDVPIKVAYTREDYEKAIEEFSSYDLILVDNAGRNFREKNYVSELKANLTITEPVDTYLVLSLSAKPNDIIDIYNQFDEIPIKQVIFSKVDETRQYGSILNIALEKEIGIAYLTDGQDVPEDLIYPNPKVISELVMSRYYES